MIPVKEDKVEEESSALLHCVCTANRETLR